MLTTFYPPFHFGGDGVGIRRLCRALVRRGHEVTVVHDVDAFRLLNRGADPEPEAPIPGLSVVGLRSRWGALSELLTHQVGRPVVHRGRIRSILASGEFDVINYHNASLIGGPGLLAMGAGVKIYMAHEHWLVCPTHVLWRHGREACPARQCLRCTLRQRRPPQLWRYTGLLRRNLHHVDAFVAMSEFSRDKHREFGFPRDMEVLPYFVPDLQEHGVEAEPGAEDGAQQAGRLHDRPYVLFTGRLERIKGLDEVIPAFMGQPAADLLIVGDGTHGAALRRLARGSPRVRFLGQVSSELLRQYYQHALAVLVPSVCFETFGIVVIEAFRHRVPVIARRLGPLPETLSAGGGLLFDTPDQLLAAVAMLQRDRAERDRIADAGHSAFLEHYTEDVVVPRYLGIVDRAAERRAATRRGSGA